MLSFDHSLPRFILLCFSPTNTTDVTKLEGGFLNTGNLRKRFTMDSLLLNVKASRCDLVTEQCLGNEIGLMGVNKITAIANSSTRTCSASKYFVLLVFTSRLNLNETKSVLFYVIILSLNSDSFLAHTSP